MMDKTPSTGLEFLEATKTNIPRMVAAVPLS
jgi:hypothetical protein